MLYYKCMCDNRSAVNSYTNRIPNFHTGPKTIPNPRPNIKPNKNPLSFMK